MPEPITLPIAEYLPDLPEFPASGSSKILNVYPRTPMSYGAIPAPAPISSALNNRCQGGAAFISNLGTVNLFAGDVSKLYRLVSGNAYQWQDVTNLGGPYAVSPEEYWEFEHFNGSVIAVNYSNNPQALNLATDTHFSDLGGSPPRAKHVAVVKNAFVMLGYTFDPVGQDAPQRVWWSGAGNASSWPAPGSITAAQLQSGYVDLFGDDGAIQAIRGGLTAADAVIFQEFRIQRAVYAGPPDIFQFLPAQNSRGTPAPYSPVTAGGYCYFLGTDGWYVTDGAATNPIGANKIDKTFFIDLDDKYIGRIRGEADPINKMIWWAYPSKSSGLGVLDRLLGYNWQLQRWTLVELTVEYLAWMLGLGYSLDELWTVLGYTLDTLPAPLDSSVWSGGSLRLGLFDTNHKLNFLTGPALAATVETTENQPVPGRRAQILSARPLIDGTGSGGPAVSTGHRERQQNVVTYTMPSALNALGACPQRASGRYLRAVITVGAGGDWTNISGVELEVVPQGKR